MAVKRTDYKVSGQEASGIRTNQTLPADELLELHPPEEIDE